MSLWVLMQSVAWRGSSPKWPIVCIALVAKFCSLTYGMFVVGFGQIQSAGSLSSRELHMLLPAEDATLLVP